MSPHHRSLRPITAGRLTGKPALSPDYRGSRLSAHARARLITSTKRYRPLVLGQAARVRLRHPGGSTKQGDTPLECRPGRAP
jgi:hypothetical protein